MYMYTYLLWLSWLFLDIIFFNIWSLGKLICCIVQYEWFFWLLIFPKTKGCQRRMPPIPTNHQPLLYQKKKKSFFSKIYLQFDFSVSVQRKMCKSGFKVNLSQWSNILILKYLRKQNYAEFNYAKDYERILNFKLIKISLAKVHENQTLWVLRRVLHPKLAPTMK